MQTYSHRNSLLITLLVGAPLAVASPAFAQDDARTQDAPVKERLQDAADQAKPQGPSFFETDLVIGKPVSLPASEDGAEPRVVGSLRDLVLDVGSGALTHAAIATPSATRLVPIDRLTWNSEAQGWHLGVLEAELDNADRFDAKTIDSLGGTAEASARRGDATDADADADAPKRMTRTLVSTLEGLELNVKEGSIGRAGGLIIEAGSNTIAFVGLDLRTPRTPDQEKAEARRLMLPWNSLSLHRSETAGEAPTFKLDMDLGQLRKLPALGEDEGSRLIDREYRLKLYRAFALTPPIYDLAAPKRDAVKD